MIIKLQCPYCHVKLQLNSENFSNKKTIEFIKCSQCKKIFHVDDIESLYKTLEEINNLSDDEEDKESSNNTNNELDYIIKNPEDEDNHNKKSLQIIGDIIELIAEFWDF